MKSQSRTSSKYFTSNGFRKPCYSECKVNIHSSSKARLQDISLRVFVFKCNLKSFKMTYPEMTNAVGKESKCGNPVKMCSM